MTVSDINKEHTVWAQAQWTDPEPDTLYASVQSSKKDSAKYFVFSGNATWLSVTQARELRDWLSQNLRWIQDRPRRKEVVVPVGMDIPKMFSAVLRDHRWVTGYGMCSCQAKLDAHRPIAEVMADHQTAELMKLIPEIQADTLDQISHWTRHKTEGLDAPQYANERGYYLQRHNVLEVGRWLRTQAEGIRKGEPVDAEAAGEGGTGEEAADGNNI